ncbi:Cytochrome c oxidase assembly, partial [Olea europaea subsp. europaea]
MPTAGKVGDWAFKAFTAGLGVATIYLAATFSVNVYRGLAWHSSQS